MSSNPAGRARKVPAYCLHKQTGAAYVTIRGRQHRLGKHGTTESHSAYARLIAEWNATGADSSLADARLTIPATLLINDVVAAFWEHAKAYYLKPDGSPAGELALYRYALRLFRHLYGRTPALEFGPKALKALREAMIRPLEWADPTTGKAIKHTAWCRKTANHQTNRIKHVFKWAAEEEILPGSIYQNLRAVAGLCQGRTVARESAPVKPVAADTIAKVLSFLPAPVRAMVELEAITGARGSELCQMRGQNIDYANPDCWIYTPAAHKTAHHGHERKVPLGKRCQEIMRPFLDQPPDAYLFSPRRWADDRRARRNAARRTPLSCGNRPGTNRIRSPQRPPSDQYDRHSYARAIARACSLAFPPPDELRAIRIRTGLKRSRIESRSEWRARLGPEKWAEAEAWRKTHSFSPHRLRHSAATQLRKLYGLEAAAVILGHKSLSMTEVYAEQDQALAIKVMSEIG